MRVIRDRQIRTVLVIIEVPVLIFIAAVCFMGTDRSLSYNEAGIQEVCQITASRPAAWQYIVLHHSATPSGSAAAFGRYHRDVKKWDELGYHFVIGNGQGSRNGEIEASDRWPEQKAGAHAGNGLYNTQGIGICLVGDFSKSRGPTNAQYNSLLKLCAHLMKQFSIPIQNVKRHSDVGRTLCPGANFPFDAFIAELASDLARTPGAL